MISDSMEMIDYFKYLRCQECKSVGLYCKEHRKEVERILAEYRQR